MRVAIVSSLRNSGPVSTFIDYHLRVGFSRMYLFFDDPADPAIEEALGFPEVIVVRNDRQLQARWSECRTFREVESIRNYLASEVMARQVLNAEVAVDLALEDGIDWILHIDGDELFHPADATIAMHFEWLDRQGIRRVTYLNDEAVPENPDIVDFFREVTLFKRNPRGLAGGRLSPEQRARLESVSGLPADLFFFYGNGKSAARVCKGLRPLGVHGFLFPEEGAGGLATVEAVPGGDGPSPSASGSQVPTLVSRKPSILHYACCGFEHFWNKYRTLGSFDDRWFGSSDIARRIGTFHLEARDIVMTGDTKAARRFYHDRMVLDDPGQVQALMEEGLLHRVTGPSQVIA